MNEANQVTIAIARYIYTATVISAESVDSQEVYNFGLKKSAERFKAEREKRGAKVEIKQRPIWRYPKP